MLITVEGLENNKMYQEFIEVDERLEKFEEHITRSSRLFGGFQLRYNFDNGYGASIINHSGSYGLELAVLRNDKLCYDTYITDDVLPNLEIDELFDILKEINELQTIKTCII